MMRTWMRLIPALLLAIPFTTSASAADVETDKTIDQLKKDVGQLRKDVEQLRKDLTDNAAQRIALGEQLRSIDSTLKRLARDQDTIISRYGPQAPPPGSVPPPPPASIRVQNNYSAPATVRINGQPYAVGIGQSRVIVGFPAGTFEYSVEVEGFGMVEPPRTANLPATGYRITIFPIMP